jgi:hypothetical protein
MRDTCAGRPVAPLDLRRHQFADLGLLDQRAEVGERDASRLRPFGHGVELDLDERGHEAAPFAVTLHSGRSSILAPTATAPRCARNRLRNLLSADLMPSKKQSLFLPLAGMLIALIFAADALTPLGYAEWTLYVVPVALCLFVGQMAAPLVAAIACSALLAVGYLLSPPGSDAYLALINRTLGAVGIWVVALVGSRFISARREIERLTWLERGKALVASRIAGRPDAGGNRPQRAGCIRGVHGLRGRRLLPHAGRPGGPHCGVLPSLVRHRRTCAWAAPSQGSRRLMD